MKLGRRFSRAVRWAAGFALLICIALGLSWVLGKFTYIPGSREPIADPASAVYPAPAGTATASSLEVYYGEPPAAVLEINRQMQAGSVGSYSWIKEEGVEVLADGYKLPTPAVALLVASPLHGVVHFAIPEAPEGVTLAVMAVTAADEETLHRDSVHRFWKVAAGMGMGLPSNPTPDFVLNDQADGLYVLQVSVHWKGLGSVNYGFLVQVGLQGSTPIPQAATLSPSTEPSATPQAQVSIRMITPAVHIGKGVAKSIALSPDGQWLAVNTPMGIYQYHASSFEQAWFYPVSADTPDLLFSPDSQRLALSASNGAVEILESTTGRLATKMQARDYAYLAWSPDSARLVSGGSCETVTVWNASSGEKLRELQGNRCSEGYSGVTVAWSGDGKSIYAAGPGPKLQAWDASSYQPLADFKAEGPRDSMVLSVLAAPAGNLLAVRDAMGGESITILDGRTGKQVSILQGLANFSGQGAAWSPDGRYLAMASGADAGTILVWEAASGRVVNTLKGFFSYEGWAWLPDGQSLVGLTSPNDGTIDIVDIKTGSVLRSLAGHAPGAAYLAWNGDGLVTSDAKSLTWWDPASGQPLRQNPQDAASQKLFNSSNTSPDGSRWVINDAVQNVKTGEILAVLQGSGEQNRRAVAAWSPDGQRVASSDDLGLQDPLIWDPQTGKIILTLKVVAGKFRPFLQILAWSPDNHWLVGGGGMQDTATGEINGLLVVWDARTGQQVELLTAGMLRERVMTLAWSPDGQRLAAGLGSMIVVWDMKAYTPLALLQGHVTTPGALAWSPDSSMLASISTDCTLIIWRLD